MSKTQAWLHAFRLRTLPLALSSIITGSSIAFADNRDGFSWLVFFLCVLTTLFLQILSNLANDFGDSEKGTDNEERVGPKRAVQLGLLSFGEIKMGIVITGTLALATGLALIYEGTRGLDINYAIFFLVLGMGAIAAAVKYTLGKSAYGYQGLGDLFVLLFFGLVGVCGSHYLLAHKIHLSVIFAGIAIGCFATGVLNLNNMRDHVSDEKAGKMTMVVKMGLARARRYHMMLILLGFASALIYVLWNLNSTMQFTFILTLPLFRRHLVAVSKVNEPVEFDPLLKQLAISTFIFSILFAIGIIVGSIG